MVIPARSGLTHCRGAGAAFNTLGRHSSAAANRRAVQYANRDKLLGQYLVLQRLAVFVETAKARVLCFEKYNQDAFFPFSLATSRLCA